MATVRVTTASEKAATDAAKAKANAAVSANTSAKTSSSSSGSSNTYTSRLFGGTTIRTNGTSTIATPNSASNSSTAGSSSTASNPYAGTGLGIGSSGSTNAYTSSVNTSTGSNNSGSSVRYDANTDYQAIIDRAVANGDYTAAAYAEQQRNAKIADLNASGTNIYGATATNKYSSYLTPTYTTTGQQVPASGYYGNTNIGYIDRGANMSQGTAGYSSTGTFYDSGMSQADLAKINSFKAAYEIAKANGDTEGMANAHAGAEAIRAQYGYSGSADGSEYLGIEMPVDQIPMTGLPVYEAQVGAVNNVYDAALEKAMAALNAAYDKNKLEAEALKEKLPAIYQQQANAVAATAAKERMNFNEAAAASGLNSGTGSQASLAMSNALQNDLGAVRTAEANALAEAEQELSLLYIEYQNAIAQAVADNEYERAAALLTEYQTQAQSVVDVAQAQASLDLQTYQYNQNIKDTQYSRLVEQAETLAQFGDFSGYLALGFSSDQIANMRAAWKAANIDWAYGL